MSSQANKPSRTGLLHDDPVLAALQALDRAEALLDLAGRRLALKELELTHRRLEDPAGACLYLRRWANCRRAASRGRKQDPAIRVVH